MISPARPIPASRRPLPNRCQVREGEVVTHIPLGQWYLGAVMRKNVDGMLKAPAPVFWNISLK